MLELRIILTASEVPLAKFQSPIEIILVKCVEETRTAYVAGYNGNDTNGLKNLIVDIYGNHGYRVWKPHPCVIDFGYDTHEKKNNHNSKESVKEKLKQKKKESKILLKEKKARLIVKNLPFKATEENLREYFEQYGDINNIELLKKPNGTLVGCGFIQFKLVQKSL
ncbi:hypothetical protein NQ318_008002 [Aromia moschata]|uniref:RRM domain-containing protein n=1 Tax=Aromia moschata TaxID=1265417 RepID=A0AAV8XUE5_9CUCU|nr:hypothetical protein NQ318_008002 [Aromia moschata]